MASIDTIPDRANGVAVAGKVYFETSSNKLIVHNGSDWVEIYSDGVGPYTFNIPIYPSEQAVADIGLSNTINEGDIVYAQDTDSVYVANADTNWLKFNYDY